MFGYFRALTQVSSTALSWRVWAVSRAAALILGGLIAWALLMWTPIQPLPEAPAIQTVSEITIDRDRVQPSSVAPPPQLSQLPTLVKTPEQPASKASLSNQAAPRPNIQDRATAEQRAKPVVGSEAAPTNSSIVIVPRIATAPSTQPSSGKGAASTGSAATSGTANSGRLGSGTMAILRARECARLDVRDRPADCPPNEELMRMLAQERGPKYRPENAEAFSRNELAWRGIPPPCLEDGKNSAVKGMSACLRFGNTPSRVRSPREICEAKGIGACEPPPSQAAVNSALEQVRRKSGN